MRKTDGREASERKSRRENAGLTEMAREREGGRERERAPEGPNIDLIHN